MSSSISSQSQNKLHIRVSGRSYSLDTQSLLKHSDQEIKDLAHSYLKEQEVSHPEEVYNLVVDRRPSGDVVLHPEAVYG